MQFCQGAQPLPVEQECPITGLGRDADEVIQEVDGLFIPAGSNEEMRPAEHTRQALPNVAGRFSEIEGGVTSVICVSIWLLGEKFAPCPSVREDCLPRGRIRHGHTAA
jgi:hypothetical protein